MYQMVVVPVLVTVVVTVAVVLLWLRKSTWVEVCPGLSTLHSRPGLFYPLE